MFMASMAILNQRRLSFRLCKFHNPIQFCIYKKLNEKNHGKSMLATFLYDRGSFTCACKFVETISQ